ncbi:hypothetical protein [Sphingorhabdus sp.]|uniref:hypothetical protein n=1 Tax=Sphingorhabdus sp. TaxID=1902408 RepID=UPI003D813CA6
MQDHFWSKAGRADWYNPQPLEYKMLADFFIEYGESQHGSTWDGLLGKPSEVTAKPLREGIARLAASGDLKTFVLHPKTHNFRALKPSQWRNKAAFAAIFSRCRIDCDNTSKFAPAGANHGEIFVSKQSADRILSRENMASDLPCDEIFRKADLKSAYLRFLVHMATIEGNDYAAETSKETKALIRDEWKLFCGTDKVLKAGGEIADMTERLCNEMAVILRGATKRIERQTRNKSL